MSKREHMHQEANKQPECKTYECGKEECVWPEFDSCNECINKPRKPKCKTCRDTREVIKTGCYGMVNKPIPCPDCPKPDEKPCDWPLKTMCNSCEAEHCDEKPPESEFTNLARKAVVCLSLVEADEKGNIKDEEGMQSSIEVLFRACDRLDKAEADLKSSKAKYDIYKAYAENKVKEMANRIKELKVKGKMQGCRQTE